MKRRTFEEMITYFNQTVSEMDIDRKYKMTLLGIVTALLQKHDEDVAQIVRCKDCKHWRDSDGVYRRGVNAESKCPLNTQEVYAGTFYCGYAERRTDE